MTRRGTPLRGGGTARKRGGRGERPSTNSFAERIIRRPLHHAELVIGPATSGRTRWHGPPPPLRFTSRGRVESAQSVLATLLCVRVLRTTTTPPKNLFNPPPATKGGGAPKGATSHCPHRTNRCCHLKVRGRGSALCRGALAFRRFAAALIAAIERCDSVQAVLHAIERTQALPAPSIALKRSTPRAGRNTGGNDARTARERGYKPRPQEPHSLHPTAVTGRRP